MSRRDNFNTTAMILSAAAANANGPDMDNIGYKGGKFVIDITAISGTTPTATFTLEGKDEVSGKYYTILASAALNATGTTVLTVFPGLTAAANTVANDVLPKLWRVRVTIAGTTPSVTATVGASLIG